VLPVVILAAMATYYVTTGRAPDSPPDLAVAVDLPHEDELALGLESYRQIVSGSQVLAAGRFVDTVRDVGKRIASLAGAPGVDWAFTVIESDEATASCLPGGKVVVSSGLAPATETPAGLAVILGHVMAHALARHGAARIAHAHVVPLGSLAPGTPGADLDVATRRLVMGAFGVGSRFGVLRPFSREHEAAADHMGLLYVARACFDPTEAPRVWERMPPEFLSIHPGQAARADDLRAWMDDALAIGREHCGAPDSE